MAFGTIVARGSHVSSCIFDRVTLEQTAVLQVVLDDHVGDGVEHELK